MRIKRKYKISATCIILSVTLAGCGQKESVKLSEDYEAKDISTICINNDSWQLAIRLSQIRKFVSMDNITISLDDLEKEKVYVVRFTGTGIEYAKIVITSENSLVKERERLETPSRN